MNKNKNNKSIKAIKQKTKIIKTRMILASSFFLFWCYGCSTNKNTIEYKYVEKDIAIVSVKEIESLDKINLETKDNNIIISDTEFKKLLSNIIILNSYQEYLKTIIFYYENSLKKEDTTNKPEEKK